MAQFESGVKYVPYSQEQVFNKLSDLSNLESVRDKLADKVQGMEFDSDSLSFTVQGISITLRIIEREPYKCVKFESEKSPVPMNSYFQFCLPSLYRQNLNPQIHRDRRFFTFEFNTFIRFTFYNTQSNAYEGDGC